MADLFAGFEGAHGTHGEPTQDLDGLKWAIKTTAKTLREPVTLALWEDHLAGRRPLGVIPVRADGTCSWASIDIDEYERDLVRVVAEVLKRKLPLVPCRSKSGGMHLFAFFTEPVQAEVVVAVLRDLAAQLGWAGCEIFPKQARVLVERGDLGNWMVMPYFGGTYGGKLREQVGLRETGAEMSLEDFLRIAEHARVTPGQLADLQGQRRQKPAAGRTPTGAGAEMFRDGPPCLQHLAGEGVSEHQGRNAALMMAGIFLKRRSPGSWRTELDEYNQKMMHPPLPADEVASVLKSLDKKDYEYTCRTEPMASHCNAAVCRTRRWGVGQGGHYPRLTGIAKLDVRGDPVWFVDVEGERVEVTTEDLQLYSRFHRRCMEQINRCFALMKQADWVAAVGAAMAELTLIEPPPDVGAQERVRELLEEFLTNRQRGTRREDLLLGKPWLDDERGRHWFRMRYFLTFAGREGLKELSAVRAGRMVEAMGGGSEQMNVRGRGVNLWWVPVDLVQEVPDVEPQKVPGSPV